MGTGKDGRVLKEDVLAYVSKTLGGEMDMLWGLSYLSLVSRLHFFI